MPSIKQINEQGEFTLTLEQEKVGRIITHFVISIKDNKKPKKKAFKDPFRDADTVDMFIGTTDSEQKPLTPKAADMFGNLMGYDDSFGSKYARVGEQTPAFVSRIKRELQTTKGVKCYSDDLKKFGYKSTKGK